MAGITEASQILWTAILTAHTVEEALWAPCKEVRSLLSLSLRLKISDMYWLKYGA